MRPFEKGVVVALIITLLLLIGAAVARGESYTTEEVQQLIKDRGVAWAADWIAQVYNAEPVVTMPTFTATLDGEAVRVQADGPITIDISGKLDYTIEVGPWTFQRLVPAEDPFRIAAGVGLGGLLGVLITLITLTLTGHVK